MNVHIVMHESFESPGAIGKWIELRGHNVTYTKLHEGDTFPSSIDFDLLIVMGGPQCPATTTTECPHFDAAKEITFIKETIDKNKKVFGVCLGAQLIGEALGATFEHSPNREIGVYPITLTEAGRQDSLVSKFPETFLVGHWHGDMPGLTSTASVLATSEGCPRQIVRYSPTIYGFQCHFEFNSEAIEGMIENNAHELEMFKDLPYIETADELRKHDYSEMNDLLFDFLDGLVNTKHA